MKQLVRDVGVSFVRRFGMKIRDHQSGRVLGRAFVVYWGGRIHIIGLEAAVRPEFLPQQRLTYWKQELGFSVHPTVDFKNERPTSRTDTPALDNSRVNDQR